MALKNKHPFTQAGVLAYITDNRGIRYQCNQLAKVFKVGPNSMRVYLQNLEACKQILTSVAGRYRVYFIHTEAEEAAARRAEIGQFIPAFRPLAGYDSMLLQTGKLRESGR